MRSLLVAAALIVGWLHAIALVLAILALDDDREEEGSPGRPIP